MKVNIYFAVGFGLIASPFNLYIPHNNPVWQIYLYLHIRDDANEWGGEVTQLVFQDWGLNPHI